MEPTSDIIKNFYHDQHIGVYKNAISDQWCDNVINYFESNIKNAEPRTGYSYSVRGIRDNAFYLGDEELRNEAYKSIIECFSLYNYKYIRIPQPLFILHYKMQKTEPTEGYHDWHVETGKTDMQRVGVYSIYLNDVEEGGETEFLYQSKRVKPEKGTVVLFPANYTHVHRGNSPISNTKYMLTGWLELTEESLADVLPR